MADTRAAAPTPKGKGAPAEKKAKAEDTKDKKPKREKVKVDRSAWTPEQHAARAWQWKQVGPLVAAGDVWVTGMCSHVLANGTGDAFLTGLAAAGGTVVMAWVFRIGRRKVFEKRWSLRFWLSTAIASAWVMVTSWLGPSGIMTALLMTATLVLAAPWYRAHRLPSAPPKPKPEAKLLLPPAAPAPVRVVDEGLTRDEILRRFEEYFASRPGAFENAQLEKWEELPSGWKFEVAFERGKGTYGDLERGVAAIAQVMDLPFDSVVPAPLPSGILSRGILTLHCKETLKAGVPYPGPMYENGFVSMGLRADLGGWGKVRVDNQQSSVFSGLLTGDPGTGKTVALEHLGMSLIDSGGYKVLFTDGAQEGDSSQILSTYMTDAATGIDGGFHHLEVMENYVAWRGAENAYLKRCVDPSIRGVVPSPDRLGMMWCIDEFWRLARYPEWVARVTELARNMRKRGGGIWASTQGVDLKGDFGSSSTLRDLLTSMNVMAFYGSSTYAHTMVSNMPFAPNTLPRTGGWLYCPTDNEGGTPMLCRTGYTKDMTPWAKVLPDVPWDESGLLAVNKIMQKAREKRQDDGVEVQRRFVEMRERLRLGLPIIEEGAPLVDGKAGTDATEMSNRVNSPLREFNARLRRMAAAANTDEEFQLREVHEAILGAARNGARQSNEFVLALDPDFKERAVRGGLSDLLKHAYLVQPEGQRGVYDLPGRAVSA